MTGQPVRLSMTLTLANLGGGGSLYLSQTTEIADGTITGVAKLLEALGIVAEAVNHHRNLTINGQEIRYQS
jgi:hypothetical protein